MQRSFVLAVLAAGGAGAAIHARWVGPYRLQRRVVSVPFPRLPPAFDGFRVLHLSDLHYIPGNRWLERRLAELALQTQADPPDVIALTGDFVEWDEDAGACAALLATLRARHGSFAVLGNHDYGNAFDPEEVPRHRLLHRLGDLVGDPLSRFNGRPPKQEGNRIEAIISALDHAGIQVLRDRAVPIGVHGQRLWIAGVDEPHQRRQCMARAYDGVPVEEPLLLLAHSPDVLEGDFAFSPGLLLAGHTHGGQIRLPLLRPWVTHTRVRLPNYRGLVRTSHGLMHISAGIGATVPLRFRCPPEVTTLVLHPAEAVKVPHEADRWNRTSPPVDATDSLIPPALAVRGRPGVHPSDHGALAPRAGGAAPPPFLR